MSKPRGGNDETELSDMKRKNDEERQAPMKFLFKKETMGERLRSHKRSHFQKKVSITFPGSNSPPYHAHHHFLSEVSDVQRMEEDLCHLLENFHSGKLQAFGGDDLQKMEGIRELQEQLGRLHFDLGGSQGDLLPPLSEEGLKRAQWNMNTLMSKLTQLSMSIEELHRSEAS
ncbi:unnamed protein product [Darwinula stevensoni]|uniref:Coiled-coil domain-containing protein 28B n=1 Tax=Darwinula stevensoni TaxID=69355 RepID=A0A7R9A3K7_9CRUS|nr:unnamed protein product [Darwinula stevensoni]CAG0891831.1 unnamed protein product [Darwinula stevensoni]